MNRKIIPVAAALVAVCIAGMAYFVFPPRAVSGNEEMRIDRFALRSAESGKAIEIVLHGSGFDSDPRVSLSLDVANSTAIAGTLKTWGALQDVAPTGEFAVLANGDQGVLVADISDPAYPVILGSVKISDKAMAVEVRGKLAYVACARGGVAVVDFSLPETPFIVDKLFVPGVCWDLDVSGDYLFVAAGKSGLHVVDISRPADLRHLASLPMEGHSVDLALVGPSGLMVASVRGGVHFVDISEPAHPVPAGHLRLGEPSLSVAAGEGLGFVADLHGYLHILDLQSGPTNPAVLGRLELLGKPTSISYRNGRVYLAAITGAHVVDVAVPTRPKLVGTVGMRNARGIAVHEGYLYVANSKGGLAVVEENAVQPLQVIDYFNSKGGASNLRLVGSTLYLADGVNGFKVMRIDKTGLLSLIGQVPLEGKIRDVEVSGDYAYVANYEGGMDVLDISRAEQPRHVTSVETMGLAMTLRLYKDLALVVTNKVTGRHGEGMVNGLQIFDIADPGQPQLLSSLPLEKGSGIDVSVDEERQTAFLIAGSGGVVVIDFAEPRHPTIIGRYTLPWPEYSFSPMVNSAYRDGKLYVANGRNGLLALDVTDRSYPVLEGILPTANSAIGVSLKDNRAYLSSGEKGIAVADIGNPKEMRLTARLVLPVYARQFVVRNNMAILGNGHRGVFVVPTPIEAEIVSASSTRVVCRFPTPKMSGDYRLGIYGSDSMAEIDDALSLPLN